MKKKLPLLLLIGILLLAAFLRLYRISDYMTFLGDEGRDVLIVKGILEGNLTLLGPRSSAGDFFMGPAYYYMMAPFLWLFQNDPVGPAIMVGLVGVATVWLVYFVGKKFFSEKAGLFAAALYAVSPLIVNYSHSSWNPNVLPFFSLLLIYVLYKAVEVKTWKYFVFAGFLLGIALQLHYLALFLGVIAAIYVFLGNWIAHKKIQVITLVKEYLQILVGFIIGFSPFLAFETRHSFLNIKGILDLVLDGPKGTDVNNSPFFSIVSDVFFRIFAKLVYFFPPPERYNLFEPTILQLFGVFVIITSIAGVVALFFIKNKQARLVFLLWLILGVCFFGFYKKPIYDYHFAFLFPLPFLIIGNLLSQISAYKKKHLLMVALAVVLFSGTFLHSLYGMPFRYEPNRQRDQVKKISEFVMSKADNKPFNFALITMGNSDHGYRYYFDIANRKPVTIENEVTDPKRKTVTDQLLVVCEDPNCQPLGNSLWEVSGFGRAEIVGEWNVLVVKVYKLAHYKGEKQ